MYSPVLVKLLNKFSVGTTSGFKRTLLVVLLKSSDLKWILQIALYLLGINFFRPVASIHLAAMLSICGKLKCIQCIIFSVNTSCIYSAI